MPKITTAHSQAAETELYYEEQGSGPPVVLVHGYPLDARFWERQVPALVAAGFRVVGYDRRGFGRSGASADGADFDAYAADLHTLVEALDLTGATLVGYAMGAGEVVRYLRTYGADRVAKAVLVAPLPPFLLRTEQTPHGVELARFDTQIADAREDPAAFLTGYVRDMFGDAAAPASWTALATTLPARTCAAAIPTWITDFRADAAAVADLGLPALIMHGAKDTVLPIEATSRPLRDLLPDAVYREIPDAPHALVWTHAEAVNRELVRFLLG